MLIIGEKINSTRKRIGQAVEERDAKAIQDEAKRQVEAGAHTLDVNCGTLSAEKEPSALAWLVRTVQEAVDIPLCIDSPNPAALAAGLAVHRGKPMINSINGEKARFEQVLPLVKKYNASVVALAMDDQGIPQDLERATAVGMKLVSDLLAGGVPLDEIYFDPLVRSVATGQGAALECLFLMAELGKKFPGLHFVSGLSNVSFGLPERRHLNRAFVVLSIASGLDAVIMDPLDATMTALIYASEALANKDRFCMNYIKAFRAGKLKAL
jgi:cobalamin-dependent methionine synthase I